MGRIDPPHQRKHSMTDILVISCQHDRARSWQPRRALTSWQLSHYNRPWRKLLAVIIVRWKNRRPPEKRSLQGFLWSKFPALCRRKTGIAPTVTLRWKSSGKRLSVKNCGSSLQKWNGSSMSRKCWAVRNARKTVLPLSLGLKHQIRCWSTASGNVAVAAKMRFL